MKLMTAEPFFTFNPIPEATPIGHAAGLLEDEEGGQVFLHGTLTFVWDAGDDAARRATAVNLWRIKVASAAQIGAAFGVGEDTIWTWHRALGTQGIGALVNEKRGPKGGSKLTGELITHIHELKATKASNVSIAAQVGVSEFSVRRALKLDPATGKTPTPTPSAVPARIHEATAPRQEQLPLLADPAARTEERVAVTSGELTEALPVFTPAARIPYAGMLLALPALEATGLTACMEQVYGGLLPGFYGLNTTILETIFRTLAGEPRAEGATRINPTDFGRILGLDRGPEVKTIRRKHHELASRGKAPELLEALGRHHLARHESEAVGLGLVLYVDGHVRSYQGTKKTGKQYSTRLKFPVPATMETWVADSHGSPVLMCMAEPSSSLVGELRRLVPTLRAMIGDDRRVLIGFDREGWSPALFHDLTEAGFDPLTWRKGETANLSKELFGKHSHTDAWGNTYAYEQVADTTVNLEYGPTKNPVVFPMRQISRIVAAGQQVREATGEDTRQIHLLTSNTELPAAQLLHLISARWRHENYFRYARTHFALDAHDSYQGILDDPGRSVPNPAKAKAKAKRDVLAVKTRALAGIVDTQELELATPEPGETRLITNAMLTDLRMPLVRAEQELQAAHTAYQELPARLPLGEVSPEQQVLETEVKQLLHGFRMAAYNIMMMLVSEIRTNTSYKAARTKAHHLVRQFLKHSGDLDPRHPGYLDVILDPMPTKHETQALAELCENLSNTRTVYPGTHRILRYRVKT